LFSHSDISRTELDIFNSLEPWEETCALENHSPVQPRLGYTFAVYQHFPLCGVQEARNDIEHRRFPASASSDNGQELIGLHHKVDILYSEPLIRVLDIELFGYVAYNDLPSGIICSHDYTSCITLDNSSRGMRRSP
jgi:hypothetical protein